jgi:hypothetical protein
MINIIGVVIIVLGFIAPFIVPATGYIPSSIFFWLGFLALLSSSKFIPKTVNWNNWARTGLLANMLMYVTVMIIPFHLSIMLTFSYTLFELLRWICSPFTFLFNIFFPSEWIKLPNGGIVGYVSHIRVATTSFIDILIYLTAGILIGRWLQIRKNKG